MSGPALTPVDLRPRQAPPTLIDRPLAADRRPLTGESVARGGPRLAAMDSDLARRFAHLVAWGRVGIGVTAITAPTLMARPWIGPSAEGAAARLLARTMGGRDLALGFGALRALARSDQEARPWVALGGMADAVDALASLVAFRTLPRVTRWGILASTVGAALVSFGVAASLDGAEQDERTEPLVPST